MSGQGSGMINSETPKIMKARGVRDQLAWNREAREDREGVKSATH